MVAARDTEEEYTKTIGEEPVRSALMNGLQLSIWAMIGSAKAWWLTQEAIIETHGKEPVRPAPSPTRLSRPPPRLPSSLPMNVPGISTREPGALNPTRYQAAATLPHYPALRS